MLWKNRMILILLSALIAVSLVSAIEFKNAILLDEGVFNDFGIRLNDSFEVTGDINISLFNCSAGTGEGILNFIGYSSSKSINVDDVIFYKQDGSSLGYQDAKTNNWIEGINESIEGFDVGDEATTLIEYGTYWVRSFLAVNMTFPNVGGSNSSETIAYDDLLLYNGTDYLNMVNAGSEGWIQSTIQTWSFDSFGRTCPIMQVQLIITGNLITWKGYLIFSNKPNIFLLFENTTITPDTFLIRLQTATSSDEIIIELKEDTKFGDLVKAIKILWRIYIT